MKKFFGVLTVVLLVFLLASPGFTKEYPGKKIFFIDSYHEGYPWSDGIVNGVKESLKNTGIDLKIAHMDTKRNGSEEAKKQMGMKVKEEIEAYKPDVVIAADDNASQYVIVPYFKDSATPFVFCGINWDASAYGFPSKNVTGMLEVTEADALVKLLRGIAKGQAVGFIADDTETNRKEVEIYKKVFNMDFVAYYAKNMEEFKKGYLELQEKTGSLIFYGWAAIKDWNEAEAVEFLQKNTKIPSGTFQEEVMPYVMIGYLKVPEEQGIWAVDAALKILDGTKPMDIPVAKNKQGVLMLNAKLAEKAGVPLPYELIQSASKVIQ